VDRQREVFRGERAFERERGFRDQFAGAGADETDAEHAA
jgi:hypothetical protein